MKNILIDMPVEAAALEHLRSIKGLNVRLIEPKEESRPLSTDIIGDVHILFCTFPPENISEMKCLELIQISTAGYSQLYTLRVAEKGVRACNALGIYDVPIAEWNLAMMVNLARDLRGMIRNQEAQIWDRAAVFQREIRGLTVGIWGYGGIGRETARLAKALGMRVHVRSRNGISRRTNTYHVPGVGDPEGVLPDRVFLRIPFRPSLLRQTSVREPVPLVRTPLSRCFPVHRRKQPRCPRVENTFRARTRFRRSLSKSSPTTAGAGPNASTPKASLRHASIGACQHALEITSR